MSEVKKYISTVGNHRGYISELNSGIKLPNHYRTRDLLKNKLNIKMKREPDDNECYTDNKSVEFPTRVRSHARSLRAMANPSAVWAHFDLCPDDPLRAQCRICGSSVVRGGANPRQCGTTNLHRHLRVHHGGRLIGRRYHVIQSNMQHTSNKPMKLASSVLKPQIKNPSVSNTISHQQPKTLVLKTIPLKVKQVASTTIKLPPKQSFLKPPPPVEIPQHSPEVCLRWNSYHSNMQNSFPSLLDSEQFVDVTLACEGRSLKCHKMILSTCSDYLASLLRENPCQHPIIFMKDLKFWEIDALVKFMYRGEVNVAHDKLPQLLNAAEALQIKGLAGPSNSSSSPPSSSQNSKPSLPVSQPKPTTSKIHFDTKKKRKIEAPIVSSPKRVPKRLIKDNIDRPFTKIHLQRPTTPNSIAPTIKVEPLDIPLSPVDMFNENSQDLIYQNDDPGGHNNKLNLRNSVNNFNDINDNEHENMEFVPTDFLEQEQRVVDEIDNDYSKSSEDDLIRRTIYKSEDEIEEDDNTNHLIKSNLSNREKI